ncbi:MAG: hypothetical protein JWP01_749 [Myxococcales bacterium]|nr:hypothetical protein [Myxococcales bacterium]
MGSDRGLLLDVKDVLTRRVGAARRGNRRHGDDRPARERLLARIAADSAVVITAAGPTLTQPRMRAVIDVLRPHGPARMGCAIDLAADHVALGVTEARSAVLVIESRRDPTPTDLVLVEH